MADTSQPIGDRRGAQRTAAVAVLLLLAGTVVLVLGLRGHDVGPPPAPPAGAARSHPEHSDAHGAFLAGSDPVSLSIPPIGVRAERIVGVGLAPDGTIEVPGDPATPGWFTPGPAPGQLGPSVIVGHVDSDIGPAVFYRLGELRPGDRLTVNRQDGSVATFEIYHVASFEKERFPTRLVYGSTDRAELRLITCSGAYDEGTGYLGNTVAFARLVEATRRPADATR